jgi:hypothetical protein
MSHPEQLGFFRAVAEANAPLIAGASVLEIGSYDVNGSIRSMFDAAGKYVGVDLDRGPGVDLVAFGHEVDHPDCTYDITLSGECFEHDQYWRETFLNMVRMTRIQGPARARHAAHRQGAVSRHPGGGLGLLPQPRRG